MYLSLFLLTMMACIPREEAPEKEFQMERSVILPDELNENSGMIQLGNLIWFINDGGNEPALYGYNLDSKEIERKVIVRDAVNNDWEDITQNEDQVFIGDFGNNTGSRTNLAIICIIKTDLTAGTDTVTPSGYISFSYEDQIDFTPANQNTPFDCEAFMATEDSLILFTKDWVSFNTKLYTIPVSYGNYEARFRKQWNVEGLITSAAWLEENQTLYLLAYTLYPFIWVYSGFDPDNLNYNAAERTDFSDFAGTQTEGILVLDNGTLLISAEESSISTKPAALYVIEEQ